MIFKAYIKMIPYYIGSVIMYMVIFSVMLSMTLVGTEGVDSESGEIDGFSSLVAVNDLDNSEESKALVSYLEDSPNFNLVEIDFERENAVQDSLYYRKAEYILTINKGFSENLAAKKFDNLLSSEVIEGSSSEMFVGNEINSFIKAVKLYITGGYEPLSACEQAKATMKKGVEIKNYQQQEGWSEENKGAYLFFNYLPYILIMMILAILIPTFTTFFNDEIRSRSLCSPVSPVSYTVQVICGAMVVAAGSVVSLMITGTIITKGRLFNEMSGYSLAQMMIFVLICVALSAFVGVLCSGRKKAVNYVSSMVSNVLGLGMSFMCGVFVKQSLLGEGVLNASKLLPAYWYVRANNMIFGGDGQVFDKEQVGICLLIQVLFAAALLSAALLAAAVKKGKRSEG